MDKPILTVMCGIQGSGKSTYSKALAEVTNATIFSSDELRIELFGDVYEQGRNDELFRELRKRIKDCLKSGHNAVWDSTNVSAEKRKSFLKEIEDIDCYKRCVIMKTPFLQCIKNNNNRDRTLPVEVIQRTYTKFQEPTKTEGFNEITTVYNIDI